MVRAMVPFVAVFLLPQLAAGATIYSNSDQSTIIRRQNGMIQMGSGGEMEVVKSDTANEAGNTVQKSGPSKEEMLANLAAHAKKTKATAKAKSKVSDLCDYNYTAGPSRKSNCTNPKTQTLIEEESMCRAAAQLACPDGACLGHPFSLNSHWFDKYPMRCFMTEETPPKWHFNPSGYWPSASDLTGVPVCVEVEYINGTANSNDCGSDEYENVMDEDDCRTVGTCLSFCIHDEFRVLNKTDQEKFPKGCHVAPDGCVEFNNATGTPGNPKGKPLCQLKMGGANAAGAGSISHEGKTTTAAP